MGERGEEGGDDGVGRGEKGGEGGNGIGADDGGGGDSGEGRDEEGGERERESVYWYSYSIHSVLTHLPFGLSSRWALSYELFPTMIPPSRLLLEGDSNPMPICLIFQARRVVVAVHMCSDCSCVSFCPRWPRAHLPWGRFIHAEDCLVMFWSSAPSDVSLNLVHLISLFCPLLPVDAFLPGRVVLTRGLFPHSDRPCAVFFFASFCFQEQVGSVFGSFFDRVVWLVRPRIRERVVRRKPDLIVFVDEPVQKIILDRVRDYKPGNPAVHVETRLDSRTIEHFIFF